MQLYLIQQFLYQKRLQYAHFLVVHSLVHGVTLTLNDRLFTINLILMTLGSVDIVIGMNWLSSNLIEIVCSKNKPCSGLKIISHMKAREHAHKETIKCILGHTFSAWFQNVTFSFIILFGHTIYYK